MTPEERAALEEVQFTLALGPEDVWSPVAHHVEGLHDQVAGYVLRSVRQARDGNGGSPVGVVVQGERGVGKTHLLRWMRQKVQADHGYFFLIKLLDGVDFWQTAVHGVVDGLYAGGGDQLREFLGRLVERADVPAEQRARLTGVIPVDRAALDALVEGVRRLDQQVGNECQNTLRALVLYRARDLSIQEIGDNYLKLDGSVEHPALTAWGFRPGSRSRQLVLRDLSRLFALTGPAVMAVDQIDSLVTHVTTTSTTTAAHSIELAEIADGLMELREATRRTVSVVACLPGTWEALIGNAANSAQDRFRPQMLQGALPDPAVARDIVARHLEARYSEVGFEPPYPTWPVLPAAFAGTSARTYTPRRLLQRVERHIGACLEAGRVTELDDLAEAPVPTNALLYADRSVLAELDFRFTELRSQADVRAPLDKDHEDAALPRLLTAGLRALVVELGEPGRSLEVDPVQGRKPPLHARLRRTIEERTEDEVHYAFRGIAHTHARAVQSRITTARTEAGLGVGTDRRRLVLLRNLGWPTGPVTDRLVTEFEQQGGEAIPIGEDDLRTFSALAALQRPAVSGLTQWLLARRPASNTELFGRTLSDLLSGAPGPAPDVPGRAVTGAPSTSGSVPRQTPGFAPDVPTVPLGRGEHGDVLVPLAALRKHTVVFAGSGSGKTVLLRRLVEECALLGVSAIVLDPNNDLVRMGDRWPEPPTNWRDDDPARAEDYLANVEVVVWTPGRQSGRPLAFRPLPEFGPVLDDPDEFEAAVGSAVAGLRPRIGLSGRKADQGEAVLREAVEYFAHNGGTSLADLVELLGALPDGISSLRSGPKLALDMSEALRAALINDPLLRSGSEPVEPSTLLTPGPGKRARISVVNFVGLSGDEQRQGFVNQLQMALFSWVKANPAGDRPLGGLLVMDEAQTFAPSGALTACTGSTIALASQARKYGLGLVFATQAPRGLHNRIPGNAATQFYGFLNAPAQINVAKELARAKGGRIDDISRLAGGEFYVASEGVAFERVREPMCLSHHPPSPPTTEEVIDRARGQGDR